MQVKDQLAEEEQGATPAPELVPQVERNKGVAPEELQVPAQAPTIAAVSNCCTLFILCILAQYSASFKLHQQIHHKQLK